MPRRSPGSDAPGPSDSKPPPSPDKPPPQQQIDFEFLNFSHPSEAKASQARRKVRSHVTRQQHQREHLAAAAARRSQSLPQPAASTTSRPPRLSALHTTSLPTDATAPKVSPRLTSRSAPASAVTSTAASPSQSPASRLVDPFETFPVEWRSSLSTVMNHYAAYLALPNSYLDAGSDEPLLRRIWLPFVNADAVLLSSVVLLAASHLESVHGQQQDAHNIDMITLRGTVIRGINDSLHSAPKSLSDELLATIVTMATFEALFGDSQAYAMHMSGLQKLVQLRGGGLSALGLDGLLERILLWTDVNAGYLTGYDAFFPQSHFPTTTPRPEPDLAIFSLRQDSVTQPLRS